MATTDTLVLESNKSSYMGWSERKNALKSGGAQRLNRVVLYGKNLISMEKLQNLGALPPPHPPRFLCLWDGVSNSLSCYESIMFLSMGKLQHAHLTWTRLMLVIGRFVSIPDGHGINDGILLDTFIPTDRPCIVLISFLRRQKSLAS